MDKPKLILLMTCALLTGIIASFYLSRQIGAHVIKPASAVSRPAMAAFNCKPG